MDNTKMEETFARVCAWEKAVQEKAWWRDMTGLVGDTDRPFAVIAPRADATPDDLRGLGQALERWKAEFPQARHIWGLTDLLDGRCPRTPPVYMMGMSYPMERFEECYEPVALVYVAGGTDIAAAARNLSERLSGFQSKLAEFTDPETYSRWHD
jgi:hypothetical protein